VGFAPLLYSLDVINTFEIIGIPGKPASLTLCFACLLARGVAAKLLAFPVSVIGSKLFMAMRTHRLLYRFHDLTPPGHLSNNTGNFRRKFSEE